MKSLYVLHRVLRELPPSSDKVLKRHMMKVLQLNYIYTHMNVSLYE
jgi:hypothetical protein